MELWPSKDWMYRISMPASKSEVANVWRNIWGVIRLDAPIRFRYLLIIRLTGCGERASHRAVGDVIEVKVKQTFKIKQSLKKLTGMTDYMPTFSNFTGGILDAPIRFRYLLIIRLTGCGERGRPRRLNRIAPCSWTFAKCLWRLCTGGSRGSSRYPGAGAPI